MANPAQAAADAYSGYAQQKQQNALEQAARQFQLQQAAQAQQNTNRDFALKKQQADLTQQNTQFEQARESAADVLAVKHEAAVELHQAQQDALASAKLQLQADNDRAQYALKVRQIDQQFKLGVAKIASAKTVAEIHASATLGAAQIHAAATIEAAGIHASATERGQDLTHGDRVRSQNLLKRGQDLIHQDRIGSSTRAQEKAIASDVRLGMAALKAKGLDVPQDDPHFNDVLLHFSHNPKDRAAMLSDPSMPASTKAYLQALQPLVP
ncbi:MAG TPA: hypothetical protein VIG51_03935 [Candidatus Baltobacteraceae bacterium]|jgi:hypothetical protein|nr:hypothetical protein [Candidatus Baltobacteraceae bacterium]